MKLEKSNSSSFRYFLAGLQPFGSVLFWGPLTFFGLCFFLIWQYQNNPEWLSEIIEQPETIEDMLIDERANNSPQISESFNFDEGEQQESENWEQLYQSPIVNDEDEGINPNQSSNNTNQPETSSNSLFQPLFPKVSNPNSNLTRIEPVKPSSRLPENHLQKSIERNAQSYSNLNDNTSDNSNSTGYQLNIDNQAAFGQGQSHNNYNLPTQSPLNAYQVPYSINNNYGDQSQPITGGQNNYNNIPSQSSNPYQIPTQPNHNNNQQNNIPQTGMSQPQMQVQPYIGRDGYNY